jgi:phosphoribosyl 1,2-cyclic phosphate phosphodiesterase
VESYQGELTLTILGSGTSVGVPMPGCSCPACSSTDPRDSRYRASALLQWNGKNLVIDTGPEFRLQMLREKVPGIDAVLYTHHHADHIHGLDDLRSYTFLTGKSVPLYGQADTLEWIRHHHDYIWNAVQKGGGLPLVELCPVAQPFNLFGVDVIPVPVLHGILPVFGYRFGGAAYISDVSAIPVESKRLLAGLEVLIIDAVRYRPHSTHFNVEGAVAMAQELKPKLTILTHLNHDIVHAKLAEELPEGIVPAWDGMRIALKA